jgi:hypothetical protein
VETATIVAVPNTSPEYGTFWNSTRFEIAKRGVALAVSQNAGPLFRWGLVKQRQDTPTWRRAPNCDKPVRVTGVDAPLALTSGSDSSPCQAGGAASGIYAPYVKARTTASRPGLPWFRWERDGVQRTPRSPRGWLMAPPAGRLQRDHDRHRIVLASRGERGVRSPSHTCSTTKAEVVRVMTADA